MISETCVKAVTRGGCARCSEADRGGCLELRTNRGDRFLAVQRGCRTVVLGQQPLCLAPHLPQLVEAGVSRVRADFVWRPYDPGSVLDCWRRLRQGQIVAGTNANFARPVQ
jgi:hypothetical protein